MSDPTGFLNLDKPAGLTSHDCVAVVRRTLNTRKVGHGGTLDPDATGVLPIAVGSATRFLSFLPDRKGYRATFRLGQCSSTDDASGEILADHPALDLTLDQVKSALQTFQGQIQQIPPLYSAVRQQGKRLYELARAGVRPDQIQIPPRPVEIYDLQILAWRSGPYPELDLDIQCGPGTYIRAIARDLGRQLGCGGLMSQLVRWQSGSFLRQNSVTLTALKSHPYPSSLLRPIESGFAGLPLIGLNTEQARRWSQGQKLHWPEPDQELIQVKVSESDLFLGLGKIQQGELRVVRGLNR